MRPQSRSTDAGGAKRCARCGELKTPDGFFPRSRTDPRLRAHCKTCHNRTRTPWKRSRWGEIAVALRRLGATASTVALRRTLGAPVQCYLCGGPLAWESASVDHVVPHSKGGSHDPANLRWAHRRCNRLKSDATVDELRALCRKILAHLD